MDATSHTRPTTKHCIHLINENEKQRERSNYCTEKTCKKKNPHKFNNNSNNALNEIPEKTIFDEVCLHKTLYCSGTQQNLQAHPEQRNVAIQQIFRNQPEYVERSNEQDVVYRRPCLNNRFKHDDEDTGINQASDKPKTKICCQQQEQQNEQITMNSYSRIGDKYKTICLCIPVEKADSSGNLIIKEHGNKTVYCARETHTSSATACSCCSKKSEKYDEIKSPSRTATNTSKTQKKPKSVEHDFVQIEYAPKVKETQVRMSARPRTSPTPTVLEKPTKKTKPQKQLTGSVRNSAFWRDTEPEEEEKEVIVENVPHSEPEIRKKSKFNSIESNVSSRSARLSNALDHESFHSDVLPTIIEPPKEMIITPEQEIALRRSRRRTQALTLQKSCQLRKTLHLEDSRTRLIYRTDASNTSSPFRSKSSERNYYLDKMRNYESSRNTSTTSRIIDADDNSDTNTIIVVPETCKQTIVDSPSSPKSVTFSSSARCRTIEDIDARCRKLLRLNLNNDLNY